MPNVAAVLKEEITRLARQQVRRETASMHKASAQYRHDIAALKRQVAGLEQQVALLERKVLGQPPKPLPAAVKSKVRVTAKGLLSQRKRLGLTAADQAKLLGVTQQTVYNWERGVTRPRKDQVAAIVALRAVGKKEARARLRQVKK